MNIDLVVWAGHPPELTTYSGTNTYVDLKTLLRDSTSAPVSAPTIAIKSMVALDSVYVVLRATIYQTGRRRSSGSTCRSRPTEARSRARRTTTSSSTRTASAATTRTRRSTARRRTASSARSRPTREAFESTYDFKLLDVGGNLATRGDVTIDAFDSSPGATRINVVAYVDVHGGGDIRINTNGFITVTEKPRPGGPNRGDLRVDQIVSTNDDVTLKSPGAILDSDNDKLDANNGLPDVVGVNITMTAGEQPAISADPDRSSGHGGVGTPQNFLEIIVNNIAHAKWGVLTMTDTASGRTGWNIDAMPAVDPARSCRARSASSSRRATRTWTSTVSSRTATPRSWR